MARQAKPRNAGARGALQSDRAGKLIDAETISPLTILQERVAHRVARATGLPATVVEAHFRAAFGEARA